MKPNVLVINVPYNTTNLIYSYKYNLFSSTCSDIFSDNLRILLADRVDQWKLLQRLLSYIDLGCRCDCHVRPYQKHLIPP